MSTVVRKEIWLISFGDLVTLLVCFFVMLLSLQSGKGLAQGGGEHSVELTMQHFNEGASELSLEGGKLLNQLGIHSASKLFVQTCEGEISGLGLSRTLAVMRQISVIPSQGSVTLGGTTCPSNVVMRVVVKR